MVVYSLVSKNIAGEKFKEFLLYCLENSTYFSITVTNFNTNFLELEEFFYKRFSTYNWFYYKTYEKPLNIILYRSSSKLLLHILNYFDCLFTTSEHINIMEDICFFNDTDIMLGSVTHENMAKVLLKDDLDIIQYEKFADWEKDEIDQGDYEFFPKLKDFIDS